MSKQKPVCISYLRFSRPEQLKGDSIRRQLALGEAYAKQHGLTISDSFRDLGISAFRGKNQTEGSLGRLLELVNKGAIPVGSVIIVEQLDRLSRNTITKAMKMFLGIVEKGITIVTANDGQAYSEKSLDANMSGMMFSLMQMSLAHEESAKKSERLAHAWKSKRANLSSKPLTGMLPYWLKMEAGKIVVDPPAVKVVKQIVKWILAGHGMGTVCRKLNAAGMSINGKGVIARSTLAKIIHSKALIGEFQPHTLDYSSGKRQRKATGQPISDYFPRVITDTEFYGMQSQVKSRASTGGRNSQWINILGGLLTDKDGGSVVISDKGTGRRLTSYAYLNGESGANPTRFPVEIMEQGVIMQVADLLSQQLKATESGPVADELATITAKIQEVDEKIEAIQDAMLAGGGDSPAAVVQMLTRLDGQRKALTSDLEAAKQVAATESLANKSDAVGQLQRVATLAHKGTDGLSNDQRHEVFQALKAVVERVTVDFSGHKDGYTSDTTIALKNGQSTKVLIEAIRKPRGCQRNADGSIKKVGRRRLKTQFVMAVTIDSKHQPRKIVAMNSRGQLRVK